METIIYSEIDGIENEELMDLPLDPERNLALLAFIKTWNSVGISVVNITEKEDYRTIGEAVTKHLLLNTESSIVAYKDGLGVTTTEAHHDATNTYYYRMLRKGCNFNNLRRAIIKAEDDDERIEILDKHSIDMWRKV